MLSNAELERWHCSLGLSAEARVLVDQIRNSQPVRAVQGFKSVHGRYPSRKMGVTIQFESHKNELAFIKEYEHDEDVLEYYDQPSIIKLDYESASGRRLGVLHTPDFFVLRTYTAGWEECKLEDQLLNLLSKSPSRYSLDAESKWRCAPGEEYAQPYGLYYHIRSSKEINWAFQRSVEFLEDYFRNSSRAVAKDTRLSLIQQVVDTPGITLADLFERTGGAASRDDVFMLIATGELYVDLYRVPLLEADRVQVFPDKDTALAYATLTRSTPDSNVTQSLYVDLTAGTYIQLDNKRWKIAYVGETAVGLLGEGQTFTEIPINVFEKLVKENRITGVAAKTSSNIHPVAMSLFAQADRHMYAEANRRYRIISAYTNKDSLPAGEEISDRTVRRLRANFNRAQDAYGIGYLGLFPKRRSGNAGDKLPPATRTLITEFIETHYETNKQQSKSAVYGAFRLACEQRGVLPASYKTFWKAINSRSLHEQVVKRKGTKAAYKFKEFYWELTPTTPQHGERPFQIVHIDHTELDEELVCSLTGQKLGRSWLTTALDACSRRCLALSLTYDRPSYRSCMMILRELVRRFSRFPQTIVVDGGKEFSDTYFETLLARYECTKKTRPPSQSRFGSVGERFFGTTNTRFIYNLQGNTQVTRNVREITKAVNPKEHAIWTLEKIYLYLCEWAYEVYDTIEHPALGECPCDAFARGMLNAGERTHRLIPYDDEFRILSFPTTPRTTAKVYPGRGVKVNYIYYWSEAFRHPEVEGTRVSVRYDPFNIGTAFAYARGHWAECQSEKYLTLRDHSERELMLAANELRRRQTRHSQRFNITATRLARFLESIESEEVLLRQRLLDRATRNVLALAGSSLQQQMLETVAEPTILPADSFNTSEQSHSSPTRESHPTQNLETYGEF
ncbi:MAG: putative transposase [Acidobacteriota bacterium]|nr:putative transposase [Acidobacteriota bacterium]